MSWRSARCAVLAAALACSVLSAAVAAGAASATLHWVARGDFPAVAKEVNDVSCPSPTTCVAVGGTYAGTGLVLRSTDGGTHWATEALPTGVGPLAGVSCPTVAVCEAIVYDASTLSKQVLGSTDGGVHWRVQFVDPSADLSDLETVRCFSTSDCVATGSGLSYEATIILTTDGGSTWHSISPFGPNANVGIEGVACSSDLDCLVTGWQSTQPSTVGVVARTSDGGVTWTDPTVPSDVQVIWELACTSATACHAPAETFTGSAILRTIDGGATWTEASVPAGASPLFISCPSTTTCYATGYQRNVFGVSSGVLLRTTTDGASWQDVALPAGSGDATGISCPTATACVVAGSSTTGVPQLYTVSATGTASASPLPLGITDVNQLTCTTATSCVAVGDVATSRGQVGAALTTTDAGRTWRAHPAPGGAGTLWGVSCATPSVCDAVGPIGDLGLGSEVVRTTDAGASWTESTYGNDFFTDVSCPRGGPCVAVGDRTLYAPASSPDRWHPAHVPTTVQELFAVSCPTRSECVAVGDDRHEEPLLVRSVNGGASWALVAQPSTQYQMDSVECVTATRCVAIGSTAYTSLVGGAAAETSDDGGAHWMLSAVPGTATFLDAASCLTATSCLAVGGSPSGPAVFSSEDGGRRWSYAPGPPSVSTLASVTCGPSGCWVVGATPRGDAVLLARR